MIGSSVIGFIDSICRGVESALYREMPIAARLGSQVSMLTATTVWRYSQRLGTSTTGSDITPFSPPQRKVCFHNDGAHRFSSKVIFWIRSRTSSHCTVFDAVLSVPYRARASNRWTYWPDHSEQAQSRQLLQHSRLRIFCTMSIFPRFRVQSS